MRNRLFVGMIAAFLAWPAAAAIEASVQNEIVEFYHKGLDHYFISADPKEIKDLDSGVHAGWARSGYRFPGIKIGSGQPATTAVCRFYGKPEAKIDSHFYSSKASECEDVKVKFADSWTFESNEVFRAFAVDGTTGQCPADTVPVYRLWNQRSDVNHRYTDQLAVYQQMVAKGYKAEGDGSPALPVAFCMPAGGSVVPLPPAGAPSCTLSTTTATPALGQSLLLTAACTGSPTSFTWTGCAGTTSTCQTTKTTAGAASYTVQATNASGTGAPVTLSVNWGNVTQLPPAGGPVPVCTVASSTAAPTVGGSLTLTANCSQTPTQFAFYECSYMIQSLCTVIPSCPTNATSCTFSRNVNGLAHYAVAGSNAAGPGAKAGIDVEWGGTPSGGGGGALPVIPVCTVFSSDNAPLVGSAIVLSASCTGNPTSYSWTGVACTQGSCSTSSATATRLTYTVIASNALGASAPAPLSVAWQPPAAPSCSIGASSMNPTVGQTISITAACNGSPTSYVWTGCQSNGPGCTDSATVAGAKTYSVAGTNGSGSGALVSVTVNWTAAPTAAPVCTVTASSTSPFAGQGVTLTANCTNAPASYAWTNCSGTGPTCNANSNTAGVQSYTVVARNGIGASPASGVNVTWQQVTGGADFCGAYGNVVRTTKGWNDNAPLYTQSNGGFAADGVYVVSFVAGPSSYAQAGTTEIAEYNGPPTYRQVTLSKSACDFRGEDPTGASGPYAVRNGSTASLQWNVGAAPTGLVPGQTYYFNFRNWSVDLNAVSCQIGACNAIIQVNWPK